MTNPKMSRSTDATFVKTQYATSANLDARIALHEKFSTASEHFHEWLFKQVELPNNARVLEIGCGSGAVWERVREKIPDGWKITLSDFSFGMAQTVQQKFPGAPLYGATRFSFLNCDAQHLPFAAQSFDGIFANHMLYHIPDLHRALAEIRHVLKRGGKFYAATNGAKHLRELDALVAESLGEPAPDAHRYICEFGLENGGAKLARHFEHVTRVEQENHLRVTETEPLVAYVLSGAPFTREQFPETLIEEFRARVQIEINTRGAFHITKAVGMFIAS